MSIAKRKDVNLKLMPEAFAKFTAWCRRHGYSKQTKLALMVDDLVVGEKLQVAPAPVQIQKPVYVAAPWEPDPEPPFNPLEAFHLFLQAGWIPDALVEIRAECRKNGLPLDFKPWLPARYIPIYRKRALEAGRDPDKDLEGIEVRP